MKLRKSSLLVLLDGFEPSSAELFELIASYVRANEIQLTREETEWLTPAKQRRLGVPATPKNVRRAVRRQLAKFEREGRKSS